MGYWYSILGTTVYSELDVPEMISIGKRDAPAELRIVLDHIEYDKMAATEVTHRSYLNDMREYLLEIENVATYRVRDGREITIMLHNEADMMEVRAYLLGTALTSLCYQRNLVPLHASSVQLPHGAVAMTGNSGAGKSTLAASLAGQEFSVISDDTCAIDLAGRHPCVLPTVSRIKLWPESVEIAGLADKSNTQDQIQGKFHFHQLNDAKAGSDAIPLKAIFILEKSSEIAESDFSVIDDKAKAVGCLLAQLPRKRIIRAMGLDQMIIDALVKIVSTIPVYLLRRPIDNNSKQDLKALVMSVL